MNELASVVIAIPVFNGEKSIDRLINSIINQTYQNIIIYVIDNNSSDGTVAIVQAFQKKDSRIFLQQNTTNIGIINNFNLALSTGLQSNPTFFAWASHDDYYEPEFVEKCVNELVKDKDLTSVTAWCAAMADEKLIFIDKGANLESPFPNERFLNYRLLLHKYGYIGGLFYGIHRSSHLKLVEPMKRLLASDHLPLAEMVLLGKFKIIPTLMIYKSSGGASRNLRYLTRVIGVESFWSRSFPFSRREIEFQRIIFRSLLPFTAKLLLASKSFYIHLKFSLVRDNYHSSKHWLKVLFKRVFSS